MAFQEFLINYLNVSMVPLLPVPVWLVTFWLNLNEELLPGKLQTALASFKASLSL